MRRFVRNEAERDDIFKIPEFPQKCTRMEQCMVPRIMTGKKISTAKSGRRGTVEKEGRTEANVESDDKQDPKLLNKRREQVPFERKFCMKK